jgi:hypothetical protein
MSISTYFGLADSLGIESFFSLQEFNHKLVMKRLQGEKDAKNEANEIANTLLLRANANSQRFAVVFQADLEEEDAKIIESKLEEGEYKEALKYLKYASKEVRLARGVGGNRQKMWRLIPLDKESDPNQ